MSRIPGIAILAVLLTVVLSASLAFSRDDEDFPVSCYLGTQEQYEEVGTIDVFNPSKNAVGLCNAIYRDCNDRCWACWTDSEGDAFCKDLSGRRFSR